MQKKETSFRVEALSRNIKSLVTKHLKQTIPRILGESIVSAGRWKKYVFVFVLFLFFFYSLSFFFFIICQNCQDESFDISLCLR